MIKQEIIEKISKYFKLTEYEAEKVYDEIFSIIITGVKDDNIVDVVNFGEFIIKYNNGKTNGNSNGYKKTVEFLASASMEEELNRTRYEEPSQISREELTTPVVPPAHDIIGESSSEESFKEESSNEESSVEEELRKKREEILSKITDPILPIPSVLSSETKKEETIYSSETEKPEAEHEIYQKTEETALEKTAEQEVEDISHKSFSDYFSEVTEETKPVIEQKPIEEPKEDIIPKSAVLLHNEIMGTESRGRIIPEEPPKTLIQPVTDAVKEPEHRADDNSYYIWYKDSESNPTDTQTLSYEYELLYQATKEAEYKSKLKIYVTTFILFFSIVLLLLIFSPVIYKVFFSPEEIKNIESIQQEQPGISEQNSSPNVIQENTSAQEQTQSAPPADTGAQKLAQLTQQQTTQTEQQNTQQQEQITVPPVKQDEKKLEGVIKNNIGWMDEKFNLIYIQLENGKFVIQESSWDSEAKANKRISEVESLGISGLKGNLVKSDLGAKGTWFRVRFGEFSTLEEARGKAEELKKK